MTIPLLSQIFSKPPESQPLVFLMGPTAVGKTDLAVEWAKEMPIEIISVDSAMVYRNMDIGTGKPTAAQLKVAPHHLINLRDPREPYSAAEFCKDALKCIEEIRARGRLPLLVGGTFLYFRALTEGLSPLPSAQPEIRARLLQEGEQFGWLQLHQRLQQVDPQAAARIHPNDPQRLQRALEVYEVTGQPISSFWQKRRKGQSLQQNSSFLSLGKSVDSNPANLAIQALAILPGDRAALHQRIALRFQKMLEAGLVDEVDHLYRRGDLTPDLPSLRAVGYRQVWEYLAGRSNYAEMVERAIAATRQLAKRQLTWLRSLSNLTLLKMEDL